MQSVDEMDPTGQAVFGIAPKLSLAKQRPKNASNAQAQQNGFGRKAGDTMSLHFQTPNRFKPNDSKTQQKQQIQISRNFSLNCLEIFVHWRKFSFWQLREKFKHFIANRNFA
jgi:hypothetical protein